MTFTLQQVLQSSAFDNRLREKIAAQIIGKNISAYDETEGALEATVGHADIGAVRLEASQGPDLPWESQFDANCELSYHYLTAEGADETGHVDGPRKGWVGINSPVCAMEGDHLDQVISSLEIEVRVESFPEAERPRSRDVGE